MKVLILKPSSLGDVIHALPVLRLLRLHQPEARVWWWIERNNAALLDGDPDLAGTFEFDRKGSSPPWRWPGFLLGLRSLRRERFDLVLDLQGLARSALVAWLADGALTVGLDDRREWIHGAYDVAVARPSFHTHAVDWYLEVLRTLKIPVHDRYEWLPRRPAAVASVERRWNPASRAGRWVILQPGARWDNKRWPAASFAACVRELSALDPQLHFAILGGPADAPLAARIAAEAPRNCLNLAGDTSLPEMIEWIRLSDLMITNDTGPMHVAAALRRPVLGLFGPTEPNRTGPYGPSASVLQHRALPCVPCLKATCRHMEPLACLNRLSPETVVREAARRLGLGT